MEYATRKKIFDDSMQITDSVMRYKWDAVTSKDVAQYVKANGLVMRKDPNNDGMMVAFKKGERVSVFRYDPDSLSLYSDHTIIELEDGRLK